MGERKSHGEGDQWQALLFFYGSDGTPMLTQESVAIRPTVNIILFRRAKAGGEYSARNKSLPLFI